MTSQHFCVWLSELLGEDDRAISTEQTAKIRQRLSDVFVHEIDPTFGDATYLGRLGQIHQPTSKL